MRFVAPVSFHDDVLPAWSAASPSGAPNASISDGLPGCVEWWQAGFEADDRDRLLCFGTRDWVEQTGTCRLAEIALRLNRYTPDPFGHRVRIEALACELHNGARFLPPVIVAPGRNGPFVTLDGNHRCAALLLVGQLVGHPVLVGVHPHIVEYRFYSESLRTHHYLEKRDPVLPTTGGLTA